MFKSARIKLTAWYVAIIIVISLILSLPAYRITVLELERRVRREVQTPNTVFDLRPMPFNSFTQIDKQVIKEIKEKVAVQLLLINLCIVTGSAFIAYFLAGKTLAPIEEMMEDQKRFTADASHELRTPLTAIKTEIEVSLRDKKLDLSTAKKLLTSNLEEVNKMQTLSNYLLTLSRYEIQSTGLSKDKVNLKEVIKMAVKKVKILAQNKKIEIVEDLDPLFINGNFPNLTELFTILLDNAIKYSNKNSQIEVSVKKSGNYAKIEVRDYGIGIKAADLPYIFNRFYRTDSSRNKTKTDGYGLGLAIAKSIVETYQGKIEVKSVVSRGSTFKVSLPV